VTLIGSGLSLVAGRLKEIASDIVTVRTGTVVSDYAPMSQTLVVLDNDPDSTTVSALALNGPLQSGARVMMIAYPPRGLVVVGTMDTAEVAPLIRVYTPGTSVLENPGGQYRYVEIEGVGGGGAGGGSGTSAAGNASIGAGGGAAMWGKSIFRVDQISWPLQIVPGAPGTGAANAAGGSGAISQVNHYPLVAGVPTLTKLWAAEGGVGGGTIATGTAQGTSASGGSGGAQGGTQFLAQLAVFGGDGERVIRMISNAVTGGTGAHKGGHGGASYYGGGGQGGANTAGASASVPGAGGGGAATFNTGGGNLAGGNGQIGVVTISLS